jgi:hypothetical protein
MLSGVVNAILKGFAERTIEGIRQNIRTKNVTEFGSMNASGKMADSLGYRIDENGLTIFSSEKYFTVLETGRKPTSSGASKGNPTLRESIFEWIKNKPIASDINQESLAFLIARKIGEEGSLLYRQGGKSGVISDFINDQKIKEDLIDLLDEKFREAVINEFIKKSIDGSN